MDNRLYLNYTKICKQYLDMFCKKNNLQFISWVDDLVGGIAEVAENEPYEVLFAAIPQHKVYEIAFADIILDINTNQSPRKILLWYAYAINSEPITYKKYLSL
jgi:hypothetical protein